ncbi:MAG: rod shape-determining protein RodA [Gammaproteobacteria bacterium]|nr:rod shape-determining protein RodA [Gammaproteobacteria bacterium]MBT4462454.1 rod shape-determining protein RodA [Gammaproteobacteria bacterium]MBT5762196.1 rod shape-determining protein RodA [Gammaproteobacteria bacterium]MBT6331224.1 rod shape-determining protein RodA [Gammaproteobacteria bacterium]MBT7932420.1 rod shape-determining protein RodA [Gammaproteobacteria bacterium]
MSDFIDTKKPFSGLSALLYIDAKLVIPIMIITLIGLVTIFSSSSGDLNLVLKQLTRIMIGIITMILIAQVNPDNLKLFAPILYLFTVFLLALVLLFGVGNTADRWLDLYIIRFQPSELMKILVPLMLATFYADKPLPPKVTYILIAILIVLIPVFMIMRQPDLGTALLIGMSGAIAILLAGMSFRFFLAGVFSAASLIPILWLSMHQYQKQRVLTFFNPESDPMGSGYQLMQSKIALGSGGFFGKGFFNGSQSKLGFVPERSTDFIFTAFGEEFGYLGVIILMSMYLFIALRGLSISIKATDNFGRILTGALSLTIFVYVLVNVGMVIGFLPVVGAPLPFMSYGGTSMVTLFATIGMIMSVKSHQRILRK